MSAAAAPSIRAVLARPGVLTTFALNTLGKLPLASVGLLMLIRVSDEYGYAVAGAVDAVFAIGMGVSGALWGRVVQHVPMSRVMLPLALVNGSCLVVAGLVPADAPIIAFGAVALFIGLSEPPFGGVMRALWDRLLQGEDERHVGYSLDGAISEALFTVSPAVLVGGVASLGGPAVALLVAGVVVAIAGVAFALATEVRATPANAEHERSTGSWGRCATRRAHRRRPVRGARRAHGAHRGRRHGLRSRAGRRGDDRDPLRALGGRSAAAGLWLARLGSAPDPVRRMVPLLLWIAGCSAFLSIAPSPVLLALPLILGGLGLAPVFITLNGAFDRIAPPGAEAEIFNITMAGMMVGVVLGTPLAGLLTDAAGPTAAFLLGLAGPLLGALLLVLRRGDFTLET